MGAATAVVGARFRFAGIWRWGNTLCTTRVGQIIPQGVSMPTRVQPGESFADFLRRRIVGGEFGPGDRLPNRADLIRDFGVCSASLQKAQDALRDEGFIESARRRGTFVTERPPHLFRVGLLFSGNARSERWRERTRFLYALEREAAAAAKRGPWDVMTFTDTLPSPRADAGATAERDARRLLIRGMAERRLFAGFILTNPYLHAATDLTAGLPTLGFGGTTAPPTTCSIRLDPRLFIDRALDDLGRGGRRRVALLTSSTAPLTKLDHLYRGAAARGMRAQEPWVQGVSLGEPRWARHAVRAMFMGRAADRPDGFIVADEHLLDHALDGLRDQRIRPGREVSIVSHCNFPWTPRSKAPVRRLGYVTRELLTTAIELLAGHARGDRVPESCVVVAPKFEEELGAAPGGVVTADLSRVVRR